ncbi:mandelate racemase [Flavilitoribacter nigricans DSM 23189 = NBRC 102662]|uniref:Mandelate racemase n=2 Tax=Flavilitoribacter TaxID=2762562 RepID=A0A2D0N207_FLAN2|nr:mandelate racemase [Flavilitoribacter nigricans DSM 23189 = NBRC 102662]
MKKDRRAFLQTGFAGLAGSMGISACATPPKTNLQQERYPELDRILARPVLKTGLLPDPVLIESLELLRYEDNFICRVRSKDGAEGLSVSNNMQMISLYPIFVNRLQGFFLGKDARDLENLLEGVYVHQSNYKLQNLALWVPLATIEFAILDMLGRIARQPIGALIGDIHHPEIAVYQANNNRGRSAKESLERIQQNVAESQAKAVKFKVGGRMSKDADDPPGRTEELIPLVRQAFGDDMTIYADSNGSYSVPEAIRVGKILQEYRIDFYEEPVPFDWYEETKMVTDALEVPVAGGEQEPSLHNFRWLIGNDALDIVQPDIFYFGGMIRSMRVARMGAAFGKVCTPHISGSGLGYLYMLHFVSAVPNAGPFHEFKGLNRSLPLTCPTSPLESENGTVKVPTGPGSGVEIDSDYLARHQVVG